MKKLIEGLESIQKLIDNEEYKKASEKIDQIKNEMLSKQDAGQYMDDLVSNLR